MRDRFALLWAGIFGLALSAGYLAAQASPPSLVVSEVHASGSHRYNEQQIAATAGLKPGDPVDPDKLQEIADRLAQLGVVSRVNYRFTIRNNRAIVDFELEGNAGKVETIGGPHNRPYLDCRRAKQ